MMQTPFFCENKDRSSDQNEIDLKKCREQLTSNIMTVDQEVGNQRKSRTDLTKSPNKKNFLQKDTTRQRKLMRRIERTC